MWNVNANEYGAKRVSINGMNAISFDAIWKVFSSIEFASGSFESFQVPFSVHVPVARKVRQSEWLRCECVCIVNSLCLFKSQSIFFLHYLCVPMPILILISSILSPTLSSGTLSFSKCLVKCLI